MNNHEMLFNVPEVETREGKDWSGAPIFHFNPSTSAWLFKLCTRTALKKTNEGAPLLKERISASIKRARWQVNPEV